MVITGFAGGGTLVAVGVGIAPGVAAAADPVVDGAGGTIAADARGDGAGRRGDARPWRGAGTAHDDEDPEADDARERNGRDQHRAARVDPIGAGHPIARVIPASPASSDGSGMSLPRPHPGRG